MIEVIDWMGERWWLITTNRYRVSRRGLVELSMMLYGRPIIPGYACVPVPVFTEWWP